MCKAKKLFGFKHGLIVFVPNSDLQLTKFAKLGGIIHIVIIIIFKRIFIKICVDSLKGSHPVHIPTPDQNFDVVPPLFFIIVF